MTSQEIEHHTETVLQIGEGMIDLHTAAPDFHEAHAKFLTHLRDRANEELERTNQLLESARAQEARAEHGYQL